MSKRRAALSQAQLAFTFEAPKPAAGQGALAGMERFVAGCVSQMLKDDPRSHAEIAGAMSGLLDDDGLSGSMLYAYAAESKSTHNISVARMLALVAITERFDVLDAILTRVGARLLVGEEVMTAELGHLDREIAALQARRKQLQPLARPIRREDRGS